MPPRTRSQLKKTPVSSAQNPHTPAPTRLKPPTNIPTTIPKLRLPKHPTLTPISSSLPPSSPLSASSRDNHIPPLQNTPSDPFGFLAVERKLKQARNLSQDITFDNHSFDDPQDVDLVIFPTPRAWDTTGILISTPRNRTPAPASSNPSPPFLHTPSPPRVPTCPPRPGRSPAPAQRRERPDHPEEPEESVFEVKKKKPSANRKHPRVIVPSSVAPLPKRTKRGAKGNVPEGGPGAKTKRPRAKGKGRLMKQDADLDIDEKWAQERQARIEYFKKLEDYSFAKENVYVI